MLRRCLRVGLSAQARANQFPAHKSRVPSSAMRMRQEFNQIRDLEELDLRQGTFDEDRETKMKRLRYQSGKRGILELDHLCIGFTEKFMEKMSNEQLEEYDLVLKESDDALLKWLINGDFEGAPERMQSLSVFRHLFTFAQDGEIREFQDYLLGK